jgi:glutamyl-tRNA synthetase
MTTPRVRYAPSPTGEPHIGNIRSALFNWLYARATGGSFIVRIEDTDQNRLVPGAFDAILDALDWLGLDQDEGPRVGGAYGPYVQSERLNLYTERAAWLVAQGHAYYCDCTSERLDAMRKAQQEAGRSPGYDRHCRERGLAPTDGTPTVVRFKMPTEGTITVRDRIRGEVSFEAGLLDDFVLLKSDGFPTYHLANVVDDHAMAITHVMRAEEWLPSAPRHQQLYQAFGYDMPELVHLPIILGPDRSKLSKRHGATSVRQFQEEGYLPDAMLNFLAMLGWSLDGETDVLSREDLQRHFSLERVVASPAVFDHAKLDWYNGTYIRALTPGALALQLAPLLEGQGWRVDPAYLARIVPLEQERLKKLSEAPEALAFFFNEPHPEAIVQSLPKGLDAATTKHALEAALHTAEHAEDWEPQALEAAYRGLAEGLDIKTGPLFGAVRVAVTGRTAAPPLFDTLAVLGRERVLARLRAAIGALG